MYIYIFGCGPAISPPFFSGGRLPFIQTTRRYIYSIYIYIYAYRCWAWDIYIYISVNSHQYQKTATTTTTTATIMINYVFLLSSFSFLSPKNWRPKPKKNRETTYIQKKNTKNPVSMITEEIPPPSSSRTCPRRTRSHSAKRKEGAEGGGYPCTPRCSQSPLPPPLALALAMGLKSGEPTPSDLGSRPHPFPYPCSS